MQPLLRAIGRLPRPVRKSLRRLIGGAAHRDHWTQTLWAWHHARGNRRVDVIAERLAPLIARQGGVAGKACLDFGAGHVLSEAIVLWLAGAREVVATDYFAIQRTAFTERAFRGADPERIRAALAGVAATKMLDDRLGELQRMRGWTLERLAPLGIRYEAPVDYAGAPPHRATFDLIHSMAVLEHVPEAAVAAVLANLHEALRPDGEMIHMIHLEDHLDYVSQPFAFLAVDSGWVEADADSRGNRLRASDWRAAFAALPHTRVEVLWENVRSDARLPERLEARFAGYDDRDLRTGSVLIAARRIGDALNSPGSGPHARSG